MMGNNVFPTTNRLNYTGKSKNCFRFKMHTDFHFPTQGIKLIITEPRFNAERSQKIQSVPGKGI